MSKKTEKVIVTQEMLDENQELLNDGVAIGDEIEVEVDDETGGEDPKGDSKKSQEPVAGNKKPGKSSNKKPQQKSSLNTGSKSNTESDDDRTARVKASAKKELTEMENAHSAAKKKAAKK